MIEPLGAFVLVLVATPLEECERRDRKGLYAMARAGRIQQFTGISDPYEAPADASITIDTTSATPEQAAERVVACLEERGLIGEGAAPEAGTQS
jgi:sulfate adenylyltransferase